MADEKIANLTERQKQCLRAVGRNRQSKEIARELGLSSDTIDKHIKAALRTLGVQSRFEAARRLAEAEQYQPLVPPSQPLAEPPAEPPTAWPAETADDASGPNPSRIEQLMTVLPLPWRTRRNPTNTLTANERLALALVLTCLALTGAGMAMLGIVAMAEFVTSKAENVIRIHKH